MNLLFIFKQSLFLPKKEALFHLNRMSMRDTITYMVCLLLLLLSPDIVKMILDTEVAHGALPRSVYIVQIIVIYPLLIFFIVVAGVSILAVTAAIVKRVLGRKLAYHHLWKMTVYALTLPLIIYTVLKFLPIDHFVVNILPLLIFYFLIYKMILVYPKRIKR